MILLLGTLVVIGCVVAGVTIAIRQRFDAFWFLSKDRDHRAKNAATSSKLGILAFIGALIFLASVELSGLPME